MFSCDKPPTAKVLSISLSFRLCRSDFLPLPFSLSLREQEHVYSPLVGPLVGPLVDWSVGWWLVGWLVTHSLDDPQLNAVHVLAQSNLLFCHLNNLFISDSLCLLVYPDICSLSLSLSLSLSEFLISSFSLCFSSEFCDVFRSW